MGCDGLVPVLFLAVLITSVLLGGAMLLLARQRRCPPCGNSELSLVPPPEQKSYELLFCRQCGHTLTLAGGTRMRFAWCPACLQRSLSLKVEHEVGQVTVEEHCDLCEHHGEWSAPMEELHEPLPRKRGIVLPFRRR